MPAAPSPSPQAAHFKTCKAKFDNSENFRGFPNVPGIDFALTYPDRGGKNDGGV